MSQTTALTVAQKARTGLNLSLKDQREVAEFLSKSGFFPDSITLMQAMAKIQAGQEIGIPPFAAMSGFHSISGKPTASARLMGALIKKSGEYDYDVTHNDAKKAEIEIWRTKQPERRFKVSFTMQDAATAELTTGKNAGTWKKYPSDMLFARCISKAIRQHCPHLLYGANFYVPEELDAKVDSEGDILEAEYELPTEPSPDLGDGFGPGKADNDKISKAQYQEMVDRANLVGASLEAMQKYYQVRDLKDLRVVDHRHAMKNLNAKPIIKQETNQDGESESGPLSDPSEEVGDREGQDL